MFTMDKDESRPLLSEIPLPVPKDVSLSESREDSFNISSSSKSSSVKCCRSKSLSHLFPDDYTAGEIRKITERLLRTNSHLDASAIRKFTRSQKMTLASLALVDFMSFCSMSIMAPFFPKEAYDKGISYTVSGFVFSFYALIVFLTSPIFGKLIPKLGTKFLFLTGMFITGACNILFGLLQYVHEKVLFTTLCLVIRGFEALGTSAFSTASYVYVVNSFPQNIGSVLGILETFVGLGMSTGPALGGLLYSFGGFETPFFVLGIFIILTIPLNMRLLPVVEECNVTSKGTSLFALIRVPAVIITGLVVVVISSVWSFLDPTLEPHLRQFNLSPGNIGLIFLLFSALYGISSPAWGLLADKVDNHWSMMVWGLFFCTIGLLLLGPCPYLFFVPSSLWLSIVALSILGISVALALLPTFQAVLTSAIEGGCSNTLPTYSVVAGVWSSMYSLGEVIGPSLGGFLLQYYTFPVASTVMAIMTLALAVVAFAFFMIQNYICADGMSEDDKSELTNSWQTRSNSDYKDDGEKSALLSEKSLRHYTEEKMQYYKQSRRLDTQAGDLDYSQETDVRGTVGVTSKGAYEV